MSLAKPEEPQLELKFSLIKLKNQNLHQPLLAMKELSVVMEVSDFSDASTTASNYCSESLDNRMNSVAG